jgi:hypothetical protein
MTQQLPSKRGALILGQRRHGYHGKTNG